MLNVLGGSLIGPCALLGEVDLKGDLQGVGGIEVRYWRQKCRC